MTPLMKYWQAKNTQARLHGGSFRCVGCGADTEHHANTNTYICSPCGWVWDHTGEIIETKEVAP